MHNIGLRQGQSSKSDHIERAARHGRHHKDAGLT
jgi:hypothetical protein